MYKKIRVKEQCPVDLTDKQILQALTELCERYPAHSMKNTYNNDLYTELSIDLKTIEVCFNDKPSLKYIAYCWIRRRDYHDIGPLQKFDEDYLDPKQPL